MVLESKQTYQRLLKQEVFRSQSKNQKLKKGIIGTTTLLGSASIALNSTSILAHASEAAASPEITAPTNSSATVDPSVTTTSTVLPQPEAIENTTEIPVTSNEQATVSEGANVENLPQDASTNNSAEETAASNTANEEQPAPAEEEQAPVVDPGEPEKTPAPEDTEEKPAQPEKEPLAPKPEPEKEAAAEQPKPAEPEKAASTDESEYQVIYIRLPAEEAVEEPVSEPVVVHSPENAVPVVQPQPTTSTGSIQFNRNLTTTEFIEEIGEAAREVGQEHDLYASVMIAQAILESGSGGSQLAQAPNYNLFGIKGEHEGKSVSFATQEDTGGGNMTTIQASFRAYDDYEDCFEDYAELLKEGISGNPDFYKGAWKTTTENYQQATAFLTGKYATDTSYNKKLNSLIETYNLTQYDQPKEEPQAADQVTNQATNQSTNQAAASGYLLPVSNYVISSGFGIRGGEFHRGIDLAASEGTPIVASKAGKVLIAESHYSWGNYVVLQHDNGETTLYAHQRNFAVNAGERVEQGQTIGFVGSTGNSTGSHLHFELCLDSTLAVERLVDPATVLF